MEPFFYHYKAQKPGSGSIASRLACTGRDLPMISPSTVRRSSGPGVRYYQGNRSPNAAERETVGYSRAWLHHKGRNKHHYEYWIDISNHKEEGLVGNKMPLRYVAEMVCDRIAACEVYKGKAYTSAAPLEYYEYTKNYITIHPRTRALLEKLLHMLKDQGEEATFAYLRKLLKKGTY